MGEQKGQLLTDLKYLFKGGVLIANALPVITGFWLAIAFTDYTLGESWGNFLLVLIGSTLVMAGALTLNNWYDVDIDRIMKRTQKRPTVTGNMSLSSVLTIGIVLSIIGIIFIFFVSIESAIYALVGWVTYVIFYTMWSKRRYTMNTIIGSISGAVTPLIGWAVVDDAWHMVPIVVALILFIFQMPHTYAIAIRKYDEYKAANVAMLPVVRGYTVTKWHTTFWIACLIPLPFLITELGMLFVVLSTIIHIGWLILSIVGFFVKDNLKWANGMFKYSVYYLTVMFLMMIVVTI
ncbi:heme o synthase [Ornithinibacillus halophilus]|uniref:Protoheme IX farnesyltransferase n=1 Tax=Ornithinibacillus halophilus TaxID=930117 RepID=A0A1M5J5C4_9BACI|nr:heme o synthase [Ornithinibacillus halophilus]SHG35742.1 protoheme IX farnesyltransferase [Ornithinibacillus halophilus]